MLNSNKKSTAFYKLFHNPNGFLESILMDISFLFNDTTFLKLLYFVKLHRWPNLTEPKRFTEKLQWLKLHYRIPLLTTCVDKYDVKKYVAQIVGEKYIVKTLAIWDKVDDVVVDSLPKRFVLKTTNGGGSTGVIICNDKERFTLANAKIKLRISYSKNIYNSFREWPYKNVRSRVIAEDFLEDEFGELRDFKFYCFNGKPRVLLVASNRFTSHNFNYMDLDFNPLPIVSNDGKPSDVPLKKPACFEEMKDVVTKLCKPFPHVRVDMYSCNGHVYFGELTFFDSAGFDNMSSDEWDLKFGSWLILPEKTN